MTRREVPVQVAYLVNPKYGGDIPLSVKFDHLEEGDDVDMIRGIWVLPPGGRLQGIHSILHGEDLVEGEDYKTAMTWDPEAFRDSLDNRE